MRINPQQYFVENGTYQEPQPNYTLYFIIISIVAGLAIGLAIGALCKKK